MNETLKNIRNRRSTRAFLPEQLNDTDVQDIIDAGIYAPSATNKQPWHFTVIQRKDIIDRLNDDFKEVASKSDNEYVRRFADSENFHVFYNAPTIVLVSGDENNAAASVDCAIAVENMLLAAESLEIGGCFIGLIAYLLNSENGVEWLKELEIPEGFKQIHAFCLGYKKIQITNAPKRKEDTVNYIK
ncbi:nitroreductase family protein [Clostridium bowmanii]|uniref:nitroreductase family protein n=1 Tax=Clostridium bowmanii TaxID=132925 RepID=UPI001C0B3FE3|nr:nitroreductase family protein [Clostridium bowmanii]MBU3190525.1 nitroreductase family protein [Clostridium bowmanii]MCA1074413.1 nitroreductase family protein [Clostridium bowmanii]